MKSVVSHYYWGDEKLHFHKILHTVLYMMQVLVVREKGECQFDEREKMVDESRYLLSTIRKYVL